MARFPLNLDGYWHSVSCNARNTIVTGLEFKAICMFCIFLSFTACWCCTLPVCAYLCYGVGKWWLIGFNVWASGPSTCCDYIKAWLVCALPIIWVCVRKALDARAILWVHSETNIQCCDSLFYPVTASSSWTCGIYIVCIIVSRFQGIFAATHK